MNVYQHSKEVVCTILNQYIEQKFKDLNIKKMIKYSIDGGKKIRPVIILAVLKLVLRTSIDKLLTIESKLKSLKLIIIFVEFLHSSSLILDDMPCMDNDVLRRGLPTFHKKFGVKNAYILSNVMIGSICGDLVKNLSENYSGSNSFFKKIICELFDSNLLISVGQIIDLNKSNNTYAHVDSILNRITLNPYFSNMFIKFCKNNNLELEKSLKDVVRLNLKTFPLFYLSFLLPIIIVYNAKITDTITNDKINKFLLNIEHVALCFSIMFQACDDFEDYEKDKKNKNIDSHLKIFDDLTLKRLYTCCKDQFKLFINNLYSIYNFESLELNKDDINETNEFDVFVELLDKKIELYDNGKYKGRNI
jgi:geranylgeranyl pyrophosphate synthase